MQNKEELQNVLNRKIKQVKDFPRSAQKEVEKIMAKKYNVRFGDTVDMFNEISPNSIRELSDDMLYKLMKSIKEVAVSKYESLDPSDLFDKHYFSDEEIETFEKPLDIEEDFDIIITDWKKVGDKKIEICVSLDEVYRWRNYNKLRFNPETQRDLITIVKNGIPTKKLDINRKSINEINERRKMNRYYPVRGIININPEYNDKPIFKDGNVIIPPETHMDLIEGFHNNLAICEYKDENPDYEEICEFDIMMLTVDEANDFIEQMDRKNHFKTSQQTRLDRINQVNYIINQLNISGEFHLFGTITDQMKVFINKVITALFDIKQNRQKAVNILDIFYEKLNYVVKTKNHYDVPFSKNEWIIYITAIKYSIDNKCDFKDLIEKIDIDKISKSTNIVNVPNGKHYKIINAALKEVKENVL